MRSGPLPGTVVEHPPAGTRSGRGRPPHRRDVVRRRGDFSGRSFGLPKYRAVNACAPGPCRALWSNTPLRAPDPGEDVRRTAGTWSDAVVIFLGEVLAFQNIERQTH